MKEHLKWSIGLTYHTVTLTKTITTHNNLNNDVSTLFQTLPRIRESRQANNFVVPQYTYVLFKQSFHYQAIQMWNSLPNNCKSVVSNTKFKKEIQNFLDMNPKKK